MFLFRNRNPRRRGGISGFRINEKHEVLHDGSDNSVTCLLSSCRKMERMISEILDRCIRKILRMVGRIISQSGWFEYSNHMACPWYQQSMNNPSESSSFVRSGMWELLQWRVYVIPSFDLVTIPGFILGYKSFHLGLLQNLPSDHTKQAMSFNTTCPPLELSSPCEQHFLDYR